MHYDNENCDTDDLNGKISYDGLGTSMSDIDWDGFNDMAKGSVEGTIEIPDSIPSDLQLQYFYKDSWHDKLTRREYKRRDHVIARWRIMETDGTVRHTDSFVLTVYHRQPWYKRIFRKGRVKLT